MKCEKVKEIILVKDEKELPAEVSEHLKECKECQKELEEVKTLKALLGDEHLVKVEPELSFEVLLAVARMKEEERKRKSILWGLISVLATATVVFLLTFATKPKGLSIEDEVAIAENMEVLENMELLENLAFFEHYDEAVNEGG